ncbi:APC family permease [Picrophilus oshimae]|uniref:Amino acid permease n=1 Tax=Picrophilus torridus (strain ATCC 700027 / DSM 9790 / JCM 10055 / NBRC 100828 / KAW 2/3) TaxID=1122961 RepID=Q6L279_PICTO|nr:APC family permease [Picrophilus oshimae]AAT42923.1 amino acid permease [Picrophilus oshimae DSM 9789]
MLKSNSIGLSGLIFQGMGQLSPLFTFDGIISVAAFALGASPLAFIIGMIASLLTGNTLYQFSKRTASARGYYGYAMYGGRPLSFYVAFLYIIYQMANMLFVISFLIMIFSPALSYLTGINVPGYYGLLTIIIIIPAFYAVYSGIRASFKTQLIINLIEIAFIIIVSFSVILTSKDNSYIVFTPVSGYKDLFLGFITGSFLAYTGYGSIVSLGEEAREPRKNIGLAVMLMILIIGLIDVLISYSLVIGFGIGKMYDFSNTIIPAFIVIRNHLGIYASVLFFALNFVIIYTLFNTVLTSLTRNIYAMARDNIINKMFLKLNKNGTPVNALYLSILIFAVSLIISLMVFYKYYGYNGFLDAFIFFATLSTMATLIIHIIVNTSLSVNKRSFVYDVLMPGISSIIILIAMYYALIDAAFPFNYSIIAIVLYSLMVMILYPFKMHKHNLNYSIK